MLATQSSSCSFKSIVAGFPLPNSMFAALFILFLLLLLALLFIYSLGLLDAQGGAASNSGTLPLGLGGGEGRSVRNRLLTTDVPN